MNKSSRKPDSKAGAKHNPQRQLFAKAQKGHEEKQDARHNTP